MNQPLSSEIKNLQFLIVDDFESIRVMLTTSLKKLGINRIITATSGNEGSKIVADNLGKENQIQFIITDYNMPNGKGVDLIRQVRAIPGLARIPILLLTSQSELDVVLECVQAGANDYLIKPWKDEDLSKKLNDLSGRK